VIDELNQGALRRSCDPGRFAFSTTDELEPLADIIGQERALEALRLGLEIKDPRNRYNIYVSGDPGLGKTSAVAHFLSRVSRDQPVPPDICYVHNFQEPHRPRYLLLAGRGRELEQDMNRTVEFLQRELPRSLESEEFKSWTKEEREKLTARREELFRGLEARARARGFSLQRTPVGLNTIPLKPDGTPFSQEEYEELPEEAKAELRQRQGELGEAIRGTFQRLGQFEEEWQEARRRLVKQAAQFLIEPRFAQLLAKYEGLERVQVFLHEAQADIVEKAEELVAKNASPLPGQPLAVDRFQRYRVNVLVDRSKERGAPVVVEENATYTNLFGTVERRVQFGMVTTDFTQIRAGSFHRANGGYLVLSAANLLRFGMSWEALKIALKTGEIRIEDPAQMLGLASTEGLRPEPIPLDVKVVIIGSPYLYHLLNYYDDDFQKLFTIRSDFDTEMPWTEGAEMAIAQFIRAQQLQDQTILPFTPSGVAKAVEYAGELTGDQRKLSTQFARLSTLVREASFWAKGEGAEAVEARHVRKASEKARSRHALLAEKVREAIVRGKLVVDVSGEKVGQVNGLAVIDLGDFAFGKPSRITASVFTGKDGVVDIEREAELGGKVHTKGIMILKGYLGARLARARPLSLSATITFEQSYSLVEGDSASAAELFTLLSSLSGVPLRQGIAVTGSVDQQGRLQPVGGVNEKIEGHYLVCKELDLRGDQGVLIPKGNADNLMLPEEIAEAVAAGKFHIWACETVEEGIELLSGMPAGEPDAEGNYPQGTLFHLAQARLDEIRDRLRAEAKESD
jgi:lon-related putative ATP-dependent protease